MNIFDSVRQHKVNCWSVASISEKEKGNYQTKKAYNTVMQQAGGWVNSAVYKYQRLIRDGSMGFVPFDLRASRCV